MSTNSLPQKYNSRRTFLRTGVTATLAAAAYPAFGASRVGDRAPAINSTVEDYELDETTIDDLQKAFATGQHSSRSVTEKYMARIREIDKSGPMLNSIIELNPDALEIAESLDRERKAKGARGRLHGVPILICLLYTSPSPRD